MLSFRLRLKIRIRRDIARGDLRIHETQLEHARGVEELLRTKFTNEGMWSWMEGQVRAVYFQSYQAAYDVAKRAEGCWRYERGADGTWAPLIESRGTKVRQE